MNERRRLEILDAELAAYIDGEVTRSEAERVEAEVATCAATQRRVAGLERIRDALASPVPELESTDLAASIREAIALKPPARGWARARRWLAPACIAAAGMLAAVYGIRDAPSAPSQAGEEFRAKSARPEHGTAARWAGIQAYYVHSGHEPSRVSGRVPADAGLLFSYTNIGRRPFEFLMIFAIDARGEVHWAYPAYERAGTNPSAIRIEQGEAEKPLAEVIHLDLAPGSATLHALFMMRPLRVLDVEAWLGAPGARAAPVPWPDVSHEVHEIGVEP
jgi:hypothetical protein